MTRRAALLLVDVQEHFLTGIHPLGRREALLAQILHWLETFRGAGAAIAHVRTEVCADGSDCMPHWKGHSQLHCVRGGPDTLPPALLAELAGEAVFRKQFYSAFNAAGLSDWVSTSTISDLLVVGVHTHACILATCLDAYSSGLRVWLDRDAVASFDPLHGEQTLTWLDGRAAQCVSAEHLRRTLFGRSRSDRVGPASTKCWQHRNPCDQDEVLDEIPLEGAVAIDRAVADLSDTSNHIAFDRTERLARLAVWLDMLHANQTELSALICRQLGKPIRDAEAEVGWGLALVEHTLRTANQAEPEKDARTRMRGGGIAGVITPWNNPFAIAAGKIAPAIAWGGSALWKPALPGTAVARWLLDSLVASGLGETVRLVSGGADAARAIVTHPSVQRISFTGSDTTGRQLAMLCASRMAPFQGELGGNNGVIVMPDADPDAVARDLVPAMFSFSGQRCTAIRRVIVVSDAEHHFKRCLFSAISNMKVGDPRQGSTVMGPVISAKRHRDLLRLLRDSETAGARIAACGTMDAELPAQGCWMPAMLLEGATPDMPVVATEAFGPLAVLLVAADLDEAMRLLNGTGYGLLAAIYSREASAIARFEAEARAGILSINRARPDFDADCAFGGWGLSGYGLPEHGRWDRDFHTQPQAIYKAPPPP